MIDNNVIFFKFYPLFYNLFTSRSDFSLLSTFLPICIGTVSCIGIGRLHISKAPLNYLLGKWVIYTYPRTFPLSTYLPINLFFSSIHFFLLLFLLAVSFACYFPIETCILLLWKKSMALETQTQHCSFLSVKYLITDSHTKVCVL